MDRAAAGPRGATLTALRHGLERCCGAVFSAYACLGSGFDARLGHRCVGHGDTVDRSISARIAQRLCHHVRAGDPEASAQPR